MAQSSPAGSLIPEQGLAPASLLRAVLKNNAALLVQYAAGALVPFLLIPHLARSIGLHPFGALSVMLAWAAWAGIFINYAFQLTGPVRAAEDPHRVPALVATVLAARVLLLALAVPLLWVAYALGLLPHSTVATALCVLFLLPLGAALNTSWHLEVQNRFVEPAALSVLGTALSVAIGLGLVRGNDGASLGWAAAALVVGALVVGAGSLAISLRSIGRLPRTTWPDVKSALDDGKPLFASQLIAFAYSGTGPIVIGALSGLEQAGTYAVVDRMVTALTGAALLVHMASYPLLARFYRSDRRAYLRLAQGIVCLYVGGGLVLTLAGWLLREPVLGYLYGSHGPRPYALYLLGMGWITTGIFGTAVTGYFVVSGQSRSVYRLTMAVLVLTFMLGIPGVLLYGAVGWMGALVAGQSLNVIAALQQWRGEVRLQRTGRAA